MDTHYYGQNSDPWRFDWKWLQLLQTLAIMNTKQCPEGVCYKESCIDKNLPFCKERT